MRFNPGLKGIHLGFGQGFDLLLPLVLHIKIT